MFLVCADSLCSGSGSVPPSLPLPGHSVGRCVSLEVDSSVCIGPSLIDVVGLLWVTEVIFVIVVYSVVQLRRCRNRNLFKKWKMSVDVIVRIY